MITAKLSDPTPEIATGWVIVEIDDFNGILDAKINIDFNTLVRWVDMNLKCSPFYGGIVLQCTELHHDGSGSYIDYHALLSNISAYHPELIRMLITYALNE